MTTEQIGDQNLQRLYEEYNITWSIVTEGDSTCMRVMFPTLEQQPSPEVICQRCSTLVRTTLESSVLPLPRNGVVVIFDNVRKFEAEGCAYDQLLDQSSGKELPYEELEDILEECAVNKSLRGEGAVIGQTMAFVTRRLEEKDIHMTPPSIEDVKNAFI